MLNQTTFTHKVALITGAGIGIGFEIAKQLSMQGASVVLNDIDEVAAAKAVNEIRNLGGICEFVAGDVSKIEVIEQLVNRTVAHFGKIDIVIANAGITTFGDFFEYQPSSFEQLMRLNLFGTFFLTQKATTQMRKQQTGGRVLLMSSVTGHLAHGNLAAYGMTKAALEQLAKNLVIDLSPHQITINAIAPGATLTERTLEDKEYISTWSRITPMNKPATVQDIAAAALFLVSPQAGHITGQFLVIDGGWTSVGVSPY